MLQPVTIAGSDLRTPRMVLGGNMLGSAVDERASFALLDRWVEVGGVLVDTAAVYADWVPGVPRGSSEKTIGRWLRARGPTGLHVATKGGHPPLDDPGRSRLDAAAVRADIERSLTRLGLASLPLWFAHRDDPSRPVADIVGPVEALRSEGLLQWYGLCNWSTERLAEVVRLRDAGMATGFVATQTALAAATPRPGALIPGLVAADEAMLQLHRASSVTLLAYSAQAKGYFDAVAAGHVSAATELYDAPGNRLTADIVTEVAQRLGVTPTQVALATVLAMDASVMPIVGCSSPARLDAAVAAHHLALPAGDRRRLLAAARAARDGRPADWSA